MASDSQDRIDLHEILGTLRRGLWIILVSMLLVGGAVAGAIRCPRPSDTPPRRRCCSETPRSIRSCSGRPTSRGPRTPIGRPRRMFSWSGCARSLSGLRRRKDVPHDREAGRGCGRCGREWPFGPRVDHGDGDQSGGGRARCERLRRRVHRVPARGGPAHDLRSAEAGRGPDLSSAAEGRLRAGRRQLSAVAR